MAQMKESKKEKPTPEVKAALKAAAIEEKARSKRDAVDARSKANADFKLTNNSSANNIIEPIYMWDTKF
jgi:hypothetical protein